MFIDLMTMTIDHEPVFSPSDYACWCNYFRHLLRESPSIRYWYGETKNWYEPHVRDRLDSFVSEEVAANPLPAADMSWQLRRSVLRLFGAQRLCGGLKGSEYYDAPSN